MEQKRQKWRQILKQRGKLSALIPTKNVSDTDSSKVIRLFAFCWSCWCSSPKLNWIGLLRNVIKLLCSALMFLREVSSINSTLGHFLRKSVWFRSIGYFFIHLISEPRWYSAWIICTMCGVSCHLTGTCVFHGRRTLILFI